MPIILLEVGTERREAKCFFGPEEAPGEALTFVYNPAQYTPLMEQAMRAALDKNQAANFYATMLDGVVLEWDAVQRDPEDDTKTVPYPPTHLNLMTLPIGALSKIVAALQADMRPPEMNSEN